MYHIKFECSKPEESEDFEGPKPES